jgi:hypothetical protein
VAAGDGFVVSEDDCARVDAALSEIRLSSRAKSSCANFFTGGGLPSNRQRDLDARFGFVMLEYGVEVLITQGPAAGAQRMYLCAWAG